MGGDLVDDRTGGRAGGLALSVLSLSFPVSVGLCLRPSVRLSVGPPAYLPACSPIFGLCRFVFRQERGRLMLPPAGTQWNRPVADRPLGTNHLTRAPLLGSCGQLINYSFFDEPQIC